MADNPTQSHVFSDLAKACGVVENVILHQVSFAACPKSTLVLHHRYKSKANVQMLDE